MAIDKFFVKRFVLEIRYNPVRKDKTSNVLTGPNIVEKYYKQFQKYSLNPTRLIDEEKCKEYYFEELRQWYSKENIYSFPGIVQELEDVMSFAVSESNYKEIARVGLRYYVLAQEDGKEMPYYKKLLYGHLPLDPSLSLSDTPVSEAGFYSHIFTPDMKWPLRFGAFVTNKDVVARYHRFNSPEQQKPGIMYDLDFYKLNLAPKDIKVKSLVDETFDLAVALVKKNVIYLETNKWS